MNLPKRRNTMNLIISIYKGIVAEENVRAVYINKSIAHFKKQGVANTITYD